MATPHRYDEDVIVEVASRVIANFIANPPQPELVGISAAERLARAHGYISLWIRCLLGCCCHRCERVIYDPDNSAATLPNVWFVHETPTAQDFAEAPVVNCYRFTQDILRAALVDERDHCNSLLSEALILCEPCLIGMQTHYNVSHDWGYAFYHNNAYYRQIAQLEMDSAEGSNVSTASNSSSSLFADFDSSQN